MSQNETKMGAGVKISSDMIKPYTGDGDFVTWLKKAKLVAKLAKVGNLADFLPLYLDGHALSIYLEMTDDEQKNADTIEKKLKEAFSDSQFVAYSKLTNLKWTGEPVDVFCNEIRRLAGLAEFEGDALERMVRLAFVNGLPHSIGIELQQVSGIHSMNMSDILSRARVLTSNRNSGTVGAVTVASSKPYRPKPTTPNEGGGNSMGRDGNESSFRGKCFRCNGPHMALFCTERKAVTCYRCGEEGHISTHCTKSGNE